MRERKYSVDERTYTLLEYGKEYLKKTYKETNGASIDPRTLTDEEIMSHGLEFLNERMMEDENVFEIKC
ncbi:MAG: hypothetical protein ACQEWR_08865 [Bacillota bacterium]|uniref:Fur-regulated basic protein FbpA n=1 Tax=Bacillus pumilus TaxID=1408 RepID=A0AB34QQF4_BACPU|nr:hypothetical protein [Bacillus pumilus]KIL12213.1 hypothetical protein B4127_1544 [Bacillus pumilus]